MAAKGLDIDRETFNCSICLDLLKNPVTIPCGHSYCMSCVSTHWDGEGGKSYSCPQCRKSFTQRPILVKNTMLAILMEGLNKTGPSAALVSSSSAGDGDVSCDLCSGRKVRAAKSCLQCLVSYCKEHLQPHYDVAALKKHKLVEPTENLQENICSQHDEIMKMFCRTDQQCICYLCSVDQHKGHDTVTAAAERAQKQRELQVIQKNILQKIDHRVKNGDHLQQHVKNSSRSADAAVEQSDQSLKELLRLLDKRMSEVKQQIRSQQEAEELRVKELQDKVQQDIKDLKGKLAELDSLSHIEDHVQFLHKFPSLSKVSDTPDSVHSNLTPPPFQDMIRTAVSKLRSALQETSLDPPAAVHKPKGNTPKTSVPPAGAQGAAAPQQPSSAQKPKGNTPKISVPPVGAQGAAAPQLTSSGWFLQPIILENYVPPYATFKLRKYARKLTWDPRSLNNQLVLVENTLLRRVTTSQNYQHHKFRFTDLPQVVSKETLKGQCYFEVFPNRLEGFMIAVVYKNIRRDGSSNECKFGMNDKSWALECFNDRHVFWHNANKIEFPMDGGVVGVFVDYSAGILSFYSESMHAIELIHTVKTTFTQPLVAGARLDSSDCTGNFCRRMFS